MEYENIMVLSEIKESMDLLNINLKRLRSLDCCDYCKKKGLKSCSFCLVNINFDLYLKLF